MVFSGLPFLVIFLPLVLAAYYLSPRKMKNIILLIANLAFYAYGEPIYVLLMVGSITVNYLFGLAVSRATGQWKKIFLILSIVVNLTCLGWFKYAGLFSETLRKLSVFSQLPVMEILLPVGISFYTFQAMSYVIDVYRADCAATGNYVDFAAYISLFPQLIAGPIVRYSDVAAQLRFREHTIEKFSWGVRMFCIGLAKKVLLANQFAVLWGLIFEDPVAWGGVGAWIGMAAFALQIYFDFGGYSDMARGLGAMFGFDFCVNFHYPYISGSITEFWRRWHISLSTWFRDYVYIPLGGSRKGTASTVCNLLVVWMLTGFWHGAGWNFLVWGLYYGVLLILEKFVLRNFLEKLPFGVRWMYTIVLVMVGWMFFVCPDLQSAGNYLRSLFSPSAGAQMVQLIGWLPLLVVGCICCCPVGAKLWKRLEHTRPAYFAETVLCLASLLLSIASLVSGSYNPFLYFRF